MEEVLRDLEARLGPIEGEPEALREGITNRNYRVRFGGVDHVVRLCGAETALLGIDREAERAAGAAAHAAGVAPAVVAFLDAGDGCLVTAFVAGRGLEPADVRTRVDEVAAALRRVHAAGPVAATFSPFAVGERYLELTLERGGPVPAQVGPARDAARRIEAALPEFDPALCHNDLLPANLLDDGSRLWIIDWEYAAMGDPYFDLGNLSAMNGFTVADDRALLAAYGERDLRRLRLMRAAAEYREGMWGVVQQVLSDLDFDFAGYAREHLSAMLESDWEQWL